MHHLIRWHSQREHRILCNGLEHMEIISQSKAMVAFSKSAPRMVEPAHFSARACALRHRPPLDTKDTVCVGCRPQHQDLLATMFVTGESPAMVLSLDTSDTSQRCTNQQNSDTNSGSVQGHAHDHASEEKSLTRSLVSYGSVPPPRPRKKRWSFRGSRERRGSHSSSSFSSFFHKSDKGL